MLEKMDRKEVSRGFVIDMLANNGDKWANVIRALVLGEMEMCIHTYYLIEKIRFCISNPDMPEIFLDYKRLAIFKALEMV